MTLDDRIAQIAEPSRDVYPVEIVDSIAHRVAIGTGIPHSDIMGHSRTAAVVEARHLVMFEAREAGLSYPSIAAAMHRDHTTVIHGVRREALRRGVAA